MPHWITQCISEAKILWCHAYVGHSQSKKCGCLDIR